jgi:hypothetical protein
MHKKFLEINANNLILKSYTIISETLVWLTILKHIFTYKKKAEVENNNINTTKWDIPGDKYSLQSMRCMILKFCKINQGITIYPKNLQVSSPLTHPAVRRYIRSWVPWPL